MRQIKMAYTVDEIKKLQLKGAVYIRMSTELQVESPENQERQIRDFAAGYGIEIVKIYADLGVSGITAEGREQFSALIDDVEKGFNTYNIVLYLDESRWGRFVDSRDAEYYRMVLERKNVICHACDKPLTLTNTIADRIITLLRDESASDHSRQLSQKVFIGQCNLAEKGCRQGGSAGFGLRRLLLDEKGNPKQELARGQRKSLQTERVILTPGPEEEREKIYWIYDQFINGYSEKEIAEQLNIEGWKNDFGRPWSRGTVREVLTNEKYIGNNVFNRRSAKMKSKSRANPENEWVRKEGAFASLVNPERFYKVQGILQERHKKMSNDEMLHLLRNLHTEKGRLSALIIDEADFLPPSSLYRNRFGGLLRAYQLVGYTPERDYQYVAINQRLRALHSEIVIDTVESIKELCGREVVVDPETCLMELNHHLFISIVISRCFITPAGIRRWKIRFDNGLHPDITVAVRMDFRNETVEDYYILPALEFPHEQLGLSENNTGLLDSFRTDTLDYLLGLSINIPLDKAIKNGEKFSSAYSN